MLATKNPLSQFRNAAGGVNSMSPWDIAARLGIHYSGDINVEHGGLFYSSADWENGYANAVKVSVDDGCVFITVGVINRTGIASGLRCCGWSIDSESGDIVCDSGDVVGHVC